MIARQDISNDKLKLDQRYVEVMPRRARRQHVPGEYLVFSGKTSLTIRPVQIKTRRQTQTDINDFRHDGSDPGLSRSTASSSQGSSQANEDGLQSATAQVGGNDIDSRRPAKLARLFAPPERDVSDAGNPAMTDVAPEVTSLPTFDHRRSEGSFQSAEERVNDDPRDDEDDIDDAISEAAKETIEAEMSHHFNSRTSLVKIKRPKGWHLRKENRHLRQALLHDSPARSERQDSVDTQEIQGYEPAAILRRLPGRRRVPHTDPKIEADMRRQLELKIAYRAVAKALKPVLIELAERTENQLGADDHAHESHESYDEIVQELDKKFQTRLGIIENHLQGEESRIQKEYEAQCQIARQRHLADVEHCSELAIAKCQKYFMMLLKKSKQADDSDATDDESDLQISALHREDVEHKSRSPDAIQSSRYRWFLENEQNWVNMEDRQDFYRKQKAYDHESVVSHPKGFAVFDGALRKEAFANLNLLSLLDAFDELSTQRNLPARIVPNHEAKGLQALVSAIDMLPTQKGHERLGTRVNVGRERNDALSSSFSHPLKGLFDLETQPQEARNSHLGRSAMQRLGQAVALRREDGHPIRAEDSSSVRRRITEKPTLEIVGPVPPALHTPRRELGSSSKSGDEPKHRRKPLTFDIIMHQPEPEPQEFQPPKFILPKAHMASQAPGPRLSNVTQEQDVIASTSVPLNPDTIYASQNTSFKHGSSNPWGLVEHTKDGSPTYQSSATQESAYPPHPMGTPDHARSHEHHTASQALEPDQNSTANGYLQEPQDTASKRNASTWSAFRVPPPQHHVRANFEDRNAQHNSPKPSNEPPFRWPNRGRPDTTPPRSRRARASDGARTQPVSLAPKPRASIGSGRSNRRRRYSQALSSPRQRYGPIETSFAQPPISAPSTHPPLGHHASANVSQWTDDEKEARSSSHHSLFPPARPTSRVERPAPSYAHGDLYYDPNRRNSTAENAQQHRPSESHPQLQRPPSPHQTLFSSRPPEETMQRHPGQKIHDDPRQRVAHALAPAAPSHPPTAAANYHPTYGPPLTTAPSSSGTVPELQRTADDRNPRRRPWE
ncbi:MAG: hypothetical protein Q9162_005042 [Coniocarpon cinnabarinum]